MALFKRFLSLYSTNGLRNNLHSAFKRVPYPKLDNTPHSMI